MLKHNLLDETTTKRIMDMSCPYCKDKKMHRKCKKDKKKKSKKREK